MSEFKQTDYEKKRLDALHSYHITDTLSETEYDDIAKLASAICGTPVSLVTFIDQNYQWFKAKVGTDFDGTPREIAFCEHTIRVSDNVLIVEDATIDSRFANNPLVTQDPNIRFYAGAPISTDDGFNLGTVCVLDVIPRKLSSQQIEALKILSHQVSSLLKTRKMNVDLGLTNKYLKGDNKRLRGQLQVQAAERVLEITIKNEELQRINKELESFAYITSHDLQEPLRKIQTLISWLTIKELDLLSPKGKDYLQKIESSALRMQSLIKDLMEYSSITMSPLKFEETTLSKAMAPVIIDLQEEIKQKDARIDIKGEGRLFVNEFQFRQLLYNLLSNALKFAKKNISPHISVSLLYEESYQNMPPYFKIEFSDNGIGFDNQYSERIFKLFQRLGSDSKVAGTGIGLTIVRQIVNNHGGSISAFGKLEEGAVFIVRIPDQTIM